MVPLLIGGVEVEFGGGSMAEARWMLFALAVIGPSVRPIIADGDILTANSDFTASKSRRPDRSSFCSCFNSDCAANRSARARAPCKRPTSRPTCVPAAKATLGKSLGPITAKLIPAKTTSSPQDTLNIPVIRTGFCSYRFRLLTIIPTIIIRHTVNTIML